MIKKEKCDESRYIVTNDGNDNMLILNFIIMNEVSELNETTVQRYVDILTNGGFKVASARSLY